MIANYGAAEAIDNDDGEWPVCLCGMELLLVGRLCVSLHVFVGSCYYISHDNYLSYSHNGMKV